MNELEKKILDLYRSLKRKEKIETHLSRLQDQKNQKQQELEQKLTEMNEVGEDLQWMQQSPLKKIQEWFWVEEENEQEEKAKKNYYQCASLLAPNYKWRHHNWSYCC